MGKCFNGKWAFRVNHRLQLLLLYERFEFLEDGDGWSDHKHVMTSRGKGTTGPAGRIVTTLPSAFFYCLDTPATLTCSFDLLAPETFTCCSKQRARDWFDCLGFILTNGIKFLWQIFILVLPVVDCQNQHLQVAAALHAPNTFFATCLGSRNRFSQCMNYRRVLIKGQSSELLLIDLITQKPNVKLLWRFSQIWNFHWYIK